MKELICNIIDIAGTIFLVWLLASWIDIILHNLNTCTYQAWNMFTVAIKIFPFL